MVDEATRIRVIRAILGWDKKTMQKRLKVSQNVIRYWESGTNVPNSRSRKVLAEICNEHHIAIRPDGYPVPVDSSNGA